MNRPKSHQDLLDTALAVLAGHLADEEFLEGALAGWWTARPRGTFVIGQGLLVAEGETRVRATFLLFDSADSPGFGLPYRAVLFRDLEFRDLEFQTERWFFRSIESMCASCFGTGVLEGESRLCDTCGGAGWGVGDVLASTADLDSAAPAVPASAARTG